MRAALLVLLPGCTPNAFGPLEEDAWRAVAQVSWNDYPATVDALRALDPAGPYGPEARLLAFTTTDAPEIPYDLLDGPHRDDVLRELHWRATQQDAPELVEDLPTDAWARASLLGLQDELTYQTAESVLRHPRWAERPELRAEVLASVGAFIESPWRGDQALQIDLVAELRPIATPAQAERLAMMEEQATAARFQPILSPWLQQLPDTRGTSFHPDAPATPTHTRVVELFELAWRDGGPSMRSVLPGFIAPILPWLDRHDADAATRWRDREPLPDEETFGCCYVRRGAPTTLVVRDGAGDAMPLVQRGIDSCLYWPRFLGERDQEIAACVDAFAEPGWTGDVEVELGRYRFPKATAGDLGACLAEVAGPGGPEATWRIRVAGP